MKTLIAWLLCIGTAQADPVGVLRQGELVLTLTDEPCALSAVSNLPSRAVWQEKGETIEGCYGRLNGVVVCYFADLTVAILPAAAFRRVVGV